MRELALITLRIVDENVQLQAEEATGLYTDDFPGEGIRATTHMDHLEQPPAYERSADVVHQTSDGSGTYRPRCEMTVLRIEPCNVSSALYAMVAETDEKLIDASLAKLSRAGLRLLHNENNDRLRLNSMSRTLGGAGVDPVDMIQFYAVFTVSSASGELSASLEGVLRLDRIDMAIDEAILL